MAKKNPNDRKGSNKPEPNDSKAELPDFLRTDDWLQITPPPIKRELPDSPAGSGPNLDDQATDMIELEDDNAGDLPVPQSTMLFTDPDDSVVLADDLPSAGPLSGKLKTGLSSIKLPIAASKAPDGVNLSQDEVDLGSEPEVDMKALAGPSTSAVRRSIVQAREEPGATAEDAIGGPLKPTAPGSGWLLDPSKRPDGSASDSKLRMPSVPSTGNINATWAELDLPDSKVEPPKPSASAHPGSWHPSSGNVAVPSQANIELPPEETSSADVFSKASRPGAGSAPIRVELPKPKPIARSDAPKPPSTPMTFDLPSAPELPPVQPKGSWHPSSSEMRLPSAGEIDLPPSAGGADLFGEPKAEKPATPKPLPPSLTATSFEGFPEPMGVTGPASGWLSGPARPPAAPVGLEPTSDFKASSADIELPPDKSEGASDIFSTATKPKVPTATGSGLFSGAAIPPSATPASLPGESNLLAEPPLDAGRVDLASTGLDATGELDLGKFLPGSQSGAINFALPSSPATDARSSSIEVIDTSGSLEGSRGVTSDAARVESIPNFDDEGSGEALEAELARQLEEDDGKPDFNYLPGVSQSDSNILGDRSMSERSMSGPQSSSVNLADPDAISIDPAVDSGQPSSIFNKMDATDQNSGHVDLDEIPIMGSSDSASLPQATGRSAVLGGRLDEPLGSDLEESVFDVTMPKDATADSGMIDWSADAAKVTDRLGMQASMEDSRRAELSSASESSATPTIPKRSPAPRPTSRPDFDLDAEPSRPGKSRGPLLVTALSLVAGLGLGAGGMFLAGGNGNGGGAAVDGKATAELQSKLNDSLSKLAATEKTATDAKSEAESQRAAAETQRAAVETANKLLADEKKKFSADVKAEKDKADVAAMAVKKLTDDKAVLLADIKKATDDTSKLTTDAANAKKDAEDKGRLLDAAKVAADAAAAKLKAADATLDPILEKFKAAKLIDDKADRAKALAALPDAVKKVNLISGEGELAKLAKELTDTRDLLKKQQDDADKKLTLAMNDLTAAKKDAEKQLTDAKAASRKAMTDLQAKVDSADKRIADEVKKAVAAATKDADAKLAMAQATLTERMKVADLELQKEKLARAGETKRFEASLAQRVEQFEKDLASARAGAVVPLSDLATAKAEQSTAAYDAGTTAYFDGRFADAEKAFAEATKADPADARYWYFLGLSKSAQGNATDAVKDFKTGAEWESRAKPGRRAVAAALERVQGPARLALEAARP